MALNDLVPADRARVELLAETSLYMEGGTQDPQAMIAQGGLHRRDNGSRPIELREFPANVRLSTIYDALGDYFDHDELKSGGERYELQPRTLVIQDKEYIGKETNPLDDGGIADRDAELQIEGRPAVSVLRNGFNSVLRKITREHLSEIAAACGTTPRGLLDALAGKRDEYHRKVMAHYRSVFIFDENGELVDLKLTPQKISKTATARHELGELARHAFVKVKRETDREGQAQWWVRNTEKAEERLARVANVSGASYKVTSDGMLELLTDEGVRNLFRESAGKVRWLRSQFEAILGITAAHEAKVAKGEVQRQKRTTNPAIDREYRALRKAVIAGVNSDELKPLFDALRTAWIGPDPFLPDYASTGDYAAALKAQHDRIKTWIWFWSNEGRPDAVGGLMTRRNAQLELLDRLRERIVEGPARRRELARVRKRKQRANEQAATSTPAPGWPFGQISSLTLRPVGTIS
jgi:hypothetical protein